ncbi:MAG: branched-chain amino acid ABC transporter permease [Firmicutes bacterium]|jgi:branched-chain amino acid transport system permease protein|nr:branched-chain amino acid ABC transporter permease [Bacillota bacterium]
MNVAVLVQQLINGLAMGCIYSLVALGYTFIWNAVGIVNLAQGDFVTMAAFLYAATLSNELGLGFGLSLLGVAVAMSVFGMGAERIVYSPLKDAHPRAVMLSTLALGILLSNMYIIIWGPYPVTTQGLFGQGVIHFGEVSILKQNLFVIVVTGALLILQWLFFRRTTLGKTMRAVAQDREAATLMGIETGRTISITFANSSILAGIAGILLAPLFMVSVDLGMVGQKGFASCVIGGFGSIIGATVGGILLGTIEIFVAGFLSSRYKDAIVFLILMIFLLVRPQGILGKKAGESL